MYHNVVYFYLLMGYLVMLLPHTVKWHRCPRETGKNLEGGGCDALVLNLPGGIPEI